MTIKNAAAALQLTKALILAPALLASSTHAEVSLESLNTTSSFNGTTGMLSACVGLYDDSGSILLNESSQPETYQVAMQLFVDSEHPDALRFQLSTAVPVSAAICSGRFQQGVYSDTVLIANAGAIDGVLYSLQFNHIPDEGLVFELDLQPENLVSVRDLSTNSTALGNDLGSFGSSNIVEFNTVNVPFIYPFTAPQCEDAEGDTSKVIVERDGEIVATLTPGTPFNLATNDLSVGTHSVRAYCSDAAALSSSTLNANYGTSSAYASGTIDLQVTADPSCTQSITTLAQSLHVDLPNNVPTWEQLSCFTGPLARQALPDYYALAGDTPPPAGDSPGIPDNPLTFWQSVQVDLDFIAQWPEANIYDTTQKQIPPFYLHADYQFSEVEWDQKLRGIATYNILMKHLGHLVTVTYFTPPSANIEVTNTAEEFLTWWQNQYIPERVELARLAELLDAEFYMPWDIEPGQFIRGYGDLWLGDLSDQEQIALGQQIIDLLYAAVRPEFTGALVISNYDRYAAAGDHWKQLDLSAWDQVNFGLFTEGDTEATEQYLAEQLSGYAEMVERDGISNWQLAPVVVSAENHQRLLDQSDENIQFADIEADIYHAVIDAIEANPTLKGFGFTVGNIVTGETDALLRSTYSNALQTSP